VAFQIVLFGAPMCLVFVRMFSADPSLVPRGAITTANFRTVITQPRYLEGLRHSAFLALTVAASCSVGALPAALALRFWRNRKATLMTTLLLLSPLVSSQLMRAFAWQALLSHNGPLAAVTRTISGGQGLMLANSVPAVVLGLVAQCLPICTVIEYLTFLSVSDSEISAAFNLAAENLVAAAVRLFALRAIEATIVACFTAFVLSFLDSLYWRVLGGNQLVTLGVLLADRIVIQDWGVASVIVGTSVMAALLFLMLLGKLLKASLRAG